MEGEKTRGLGRLTGISGPAAVQEIIVTDSKHEEERRRHHFATISQPTIMIRFRQNGS